MLADAADAREETAAIAHVPGLPQHPVLSRGP